MPLKDFGKDILVTVDLADDWQNVVRHGARFAALGKSRIHLLHVTSDAPTSLARVLSAKDLAAHGRRLRQEAEEHLAAQAEALREEGFKVEVVVRSGSPYQEILTAADELKVGLLVLGAGRSTDGERMFVGSNADRILRKSSVPVLVVGRDTDEPLRRLMVPTDLDRADQGAVRVACHIAAETKGRVSVFHAYVQPSTLHRYLGNVAQLRKQAKTGAREGLDAFVDACALPDKRPHEILYACTDELHPARAIVAHASRLEMDLIVMALGGRRFLETFFIGSVAERVIRHLPCSLLALPAAWAKKR